MELESAQVRNVTRGTEIKGEALSKDMLGIIAKGGIIPALRERLKIKK
ncbi:MAG: hypothetical protein MUP68_15130 [Deltaproteobacteria bacterium]|nr:hypothetical protein [Deltaproteobacteria bacterium]